ncbi:undecaprenyl-phosphate alpha-N-acetylglucosaminyl 1-phosphate transferase [Heyndrickxia sporothermodurans]|uniref:MraY family glycosyltransferase n=1 Tax=Heyndrickxia sporothermodurans TaxID=46224 RepID=UPI000D389639|nr:MraY family glycosyltransferase [Heyndrickxia sporothermodurans]PTY81782.1 undecaprenyl-phosphate alpha-N-acetylglucosaminyl 1-phosphate transferase [Heyndrickxia sporothermodurans]
MIYLTLLFCFILSVLVTPLIGRLAIKLGITDKPNNRKVHKKNIPLIGGVAIFISFLVGYFILRPVPQESDAVVHVSGIFIGSFIILITGILDDKYELSPKLKLLGQILAALAVVVWGGVELTKINLPFGGILYFGYFSIPLTIFWIVAITNAINLIDGLDGLAAGVSSIALITISGMAIIMGDMFVAIVGGILLASTLGFLIYNFHPAKIFMGDTGALFLGYMIAVLSLLGFKNITFISLVIPVIILGVPLSDTFFAIIRRFLNKQPFSSADKSHLHHCLLRVGFSHRQTVLVIYAIAALFGLAAIIFSMSTMWGSLIIVAVLLLAIEIFVESINLVGEDYKPLLKYVRPKKSPNQ